MLREVARRQNIRAKVCRRSMAKEDCYGGRALVKMTVSGLTGRDL